MIVVGVDPGLSGALVAIQDGRILNVLDMPVVDKMVDANWAAAWIDSHKPDVVAVEFVRSMPKQGVASTFTFGQAYGTILGICHNRRLVHVRPQEWKKHFTLSGKEKDAARRLVIERWPNDAAMFRRKKDGGRADAALIAQWACDTLS